MFKEALFYILRWFWFFALVAVFGFLSHETGRLRERRILEPIIESLQVHNACLSKVNDRYRLDLNDIGGGWCPENKTQGEKR